MYSDCLDGARCAAYELCSGFGAGFRGGQREGFGAVGVVEIDYHVIEVEEYGIDEYFEELLLTLFIRIVLILELVQEKTDMFLCQAQTR